MDIAQLSMNMSASQLQQQVSLRVLDTTMETATDLSQQMVDELMTEMPAIPATGHIDISI